MLSTGVAETRQKLRDIIRRVGVVKYGEFVLASGQTTDVYFNCKRITLHPEGLSIIARIIYDKIKGLGVNSIGGLELGAIPIATAVAQVSYREGVEIPAFWIRRHQKGHGDKAKVEGMLEHNWKVALVDDVATTGGSLQVAIDALEEFGCSIEKIIVLIDRENEAREKYKKYNYESIFSKSDLIDPTRSV
ncbi:MAG: orotate phosphoribosyltransferase [Nitrososphaerales archaeon]